MGAKVSAPFSYCGGKGYAAAEVWRRFGEVRFYCEPFAGSLSVLLRRPRAHSGAPCRIEAAGDLDGLVVNFWRCAKLGPEKMAEWFPWPTTSADLRARTDFLLAKREGLVARLGADPEFYDAKLAAWWAWCGSAAFSTFPGRTPMVAGHPGSGTQSVSFDMAAWAVGARERLARVLIMAWDWRKTAELAVGVRYAGKPVSSGLFLDPPYEGSERVYGRAEPGVARDVWEFAVEAGRDPLVRVAVCGEEDGRKVPPGWDAYAWKGRGGRTSLPGKDRGERIWFSPSCLRPPKPLCLFGGVS